MYKAVLFSLDGDWVTDFVGETKDEVIKKLADKGSRWYFYPFEAIILHKGKLTTNRQRLIDVAPNLPRELVGKSIKTAGKWLRSLSDEELQVMAMGGIVVNYFKPKK